MDTFNTDYGTLHIGDLTEIFNYTVKTINALPETQARPMVGLTGGSTPKAFYLWAAQAQPFSKDALKQVMWTTSDERYVPLESDESNFGHAQRGMFKQLEIAEENLRPWPVTLDPTTAALQFNDLWTEEGRTYPFDLCLLGMGDDCHTASLFPGSSLIQSDPKCLFSEVEVPGKGMRLSVTPHGLSLCPKIIITVTGEGKAEALKQVIEGERNPLQKPSQLLANAAASVSWLVDREAASLLSL